MDGFWKHAKWNSPDIKGHILYDLIFIKCQEQENPYKQKMDEWLWEGRSDSWGV